VSLLGGCCAEPAVKGRMCCQPAVCNFKGDLMLLMGTTRCRWAAYPLGMYQRGTGREKWQNEPLNGSLRDAPLGHSSFLVVISFPLRRHVAPHLCCPSSSLLRSLVSSWWQAKTNHDKCRGLCFVTHHQGTTLYGFP
jgi:hypothetical protein